MPGADRLLGGGRNEPRRVRVLRWGSRGGSCGRWLGRLGLLCVATVALAPPEPCRQPGSCELLQLLSLSGTGGCDFLETHKNDTDANQNKRKRTLKSKRRF
ncbi:hypothetical protein Q7C36_010453 [Tachysurus vachellii]|uniref:Uncharacterized protein n=1 Tax=Tachysurus vachellii TaxID=175792 RepID=A0AA88SU40_TACVA|nr:hypothetical protein Q7C36_010453 [Tachysurus vachellii]